MDVVASFIFLGALIRRDGLCDKRYAYELQLAKLQWGIWKDRGIKLATKVKLMKALVFPIVLTMRKASGSVHKL